MLGHINAGTASKIPHSFNLPTLHPQDIFWLSDPAALHIPTIHFPLFAFVRVTAAMAAASTNQWAAVGDAVNSAALVETGFNIVRASLPYLSVALGATKMYSRGAGGYCDRLNELEIIIQSWDQILGNLSTAEIAQIDAEIGPNTVRDLCQRLSALVVVLIFNATIPLILSTSIKVSFGKLKVTHVQASFWDKVALWETPLSYEYDNIRAVVTSTDAHFKVHSTQTCTTDFDLTLSKLYAGHH